MGLRSISERNNVSAKTNHAPKEFDTQVAAAVRLLVDADPVERRAAIARLLGCPDCVVGPVIDRLADRLRNPNAKVRQTAEAVLIEIGPAAVPELVGRLYQCGGPVTKVRVADLLGRIGRRLDEGRRAELYLDLEAALGIAHEEAVEVAIIRSVTQLSPALNPGGRVATAAVLQAEMERFLPTWTSAPGDTAGLPQAGDDEQPAAIG
jgi:hypothetical protein